VYYSEKNYARMILGFFARFSANFQGYFGRILRTSRDFGIFSHFAGF
jgi:hypothetical protein